MQKQRRVYGIYVFMTISVLFLFGSLLYRIHFSADGTDETYYMSTMIRYLGGDIPVSSSWDSHFISYLLSPIILIYKVISGSYDGGILYLRYMYIFFSVMVCFIAWILLNRKRFVTICALLPLLFLVPYSLPAFSYNTMFMWLLILGQIIIYARARFSLKQQKLLFFTVGILYTAMCLSYPTMAIFAVLNICLLYIYIVKVERNKKDRKIILYYMLGGGGAALAILVSIVLRSDIKSLVTGLKYMTKSPYMQTHPQINAQFLFQLVYDFLATIIKSNSFKIILIACIIIFFIQICKRKFRKVIYLHPLIIGLGALWTSLAGDLPIYRNGYVCFFLWIMVIIHIFLVKDQVLKQRMIITMLIPSGFAIGAYTLTSNNHSIILALCYSGLAIIALVLIVGRILEEQVNEDSKAVYGHIVLGISALLLSAAFLCNFYNFVYRDLAVGHLKTKVSEGIYRGIYTTEERARGLTTIERAIDRYIKPGASICVMNRFPAAYIMADTKILSPTMWDPQYIRDGLKDESFMTNYFKFVKAKPDYIIACMWADNPEFIGDDTYKINEYLNQNYDLLYNDLDSYAPLYIYQKKE